MKDKYIFKVHTKTYFSGPLYYFCLSRYKDHQDAPCSKSTLSSCSQTCISKLLYESTVTIQFLHPVSPPHGLTLQDNLPSITSNSKGFCPRALNSKLALYSPVSQLCTLPFQNHLSINLLGQRALCSRTPQQWLDCHPKCQHWMVWHLETISQE